MDMSAGSTATQLQDRISAALFGGGQPEEKPAAAPAAAMNAGEDTLPGVEEDASQGFEQDAQGGDFTQQGDTLQGSEQGTTEEDDSPITFEEAAKVKFKVPLKRGDEETVEEVTLEELRNGYMREKDYHSKRQEDSGKVRQVQTEAVQYVGKLQQQYQQSLGELDSFVQALALGEFKGVDMNKLAAEDPAAYVRVKARMDQIQTARGAIQQHLQQLAAQRDHEHKQQRDQAWEQSEPLLRAEIPNWGPELKEKMAGHAMKSYGFTAQELSAITDHRVVKLLHDAFQHRQQPDKKAIEKAIADKKVKDVPKVLKPGTDAGNRGDRSSSRDAELKARIRKSGGKDKAAIEERIRMRLR